MHVSFSRQSLGSRGELHLIRTTGDDTIAVLQAGLHADPVAVARRDLDIAARKSFAADLEKDVRTTGFEQDSRFRHGCSANAVLLVKQGGAGLTDQELSARIVDL